MMVSLKEKLSAGWFNISDGFSGAYHTVKARNGFRAIDEVKKSFKEDGISLQGRGRGFRITGYMPLKEGETI